MGIFGALTTAVTGLRAQSYALENISGNIANAQTTAYKRVDTSFEDLIPDNIPTQQLAGTVVATSRATNSVQGDIQNATNGTFMAINGQGFFVVEKPSGFSGNTPTFDGIDLYTRRGDFSTDKNGYLVNGAGYYLMGIPVDVTTGNLVGSVPQLLQFNNGFLPAQPTTQIQYQANLASYPLTANHDTAVPGSELLNPSDFAANPLVGPAAAATVLGSGATLSGDAAATSTGTADLSALSASAGSLVINSQPIAITAAQTAAQVVTDINGATGTTGVTASLVGNHLVLTSGDADTNIAIGGGSTLAVLNDLGLTVGTTNATNLLNQGVVTANQTLTFNVNPPAPAAPVNATLTVTFGNLAGQVSTMAELTTALGTLAGGTATVDSTGNITVTAGNMTNVVTVGGTATPSVFGIHTLTAVPSNSTVIGTDVSTFVSESLSGGAITAYDTSGAPVNIQLRWAKTDSRTYGGTDTWNLFYQVDPNATGSQTAWVNAGVNYTFGANGQMSPAVATTPLNNVVVNGISLGNLTLVTGTTGVTQFSDSNGTVQVNLLQQDGYAAGSLQSVSVNDKGRVVGTYSNSRTIDLAQITLASFNGTNGLQRIDGGAFQATDESGPATYNASGTIVGSSLEGSNTDIADEFTKLIVTQQAYSANTRVITTSNTMVQDLLNMLR
jgi:flagellar hook protein FlgE